MQTSNWVQNHVTAAAAVLASATSGGANGSPGAIGNGSSGIQPHNTPGNLAAAAAKLETAAAVLSAATATK